MIVEVEEKEINSNISMLYVHVHVVVVGGCVLCTCACCLHVWSLSWLPTIATDLYNRLTVSASAAGLS
jgi:hypothetical protein